jgi:hypothetical protein
VWDPNIVGPPSLPSRPWDLRAVAGLGVPSQVLRRFSWGAASPYPRIGRLSRPDHRNSTAMFRSDVVAGCGSRQHNKSHSPVTGRSRNLPDRCVCGSCSQCRRPWCCDTQNPHRLPHNRTPYTQSARERTRRDMTQKGDQRPGRGCKVWPRRAERFTQQDRYRTRERTAGEAAKGLPDVIGKDQPTRRKVGLARWIGS